MSKTVHIGSAPEFSTLIKNTKAVVVDFYADWCGPCKAIAPVFEQLSAKHSRPKLVGFAKVNTDQQQAIAQQFSVQAMPTFILFENGTVAERVQGANPKALEALVTRASKLADSSGGEGSSSNGNWSGAGTARGYSDSTDEVDTRGLDLLNADSEFGGVRVLFDKSKPSGLSAASKGKGKAADASGGDATKDWVESDTDPQLMLYIPFQATMKVHALQITSLPPTEDTDDETPMRPRTISLYINRAHNLGFEEAEDIPAIQTIELQPGDWDAETGTANIELRFVKFQNVSSLVVFVVDGEGDGERTRIDRLRIVGESGAKKAMGKLEKIGDEQGE